MAGPFKIGTGGGRRLAVLTVNNPGGNDTYEIFGLVNKSTDQLVSIALAGNCSVLLDGFPGTQNSNQPMMGTGALPANVANAILSVNAGQYATFVGNVTP